MIVPTEKQARILNELGKDCLIARPEVTVASGVAVAIGCAGRATIEGNIHAGRLDLKQHIEAIDVEIIGEADSTCADCDFLQQLALVRLGLKV